MTGEEFHFLVCLWQSIWTRWFWQCCLWRQGGENPSHCLVAVAILCIPHILLYLGICLATYILCACLLPIRTAARVESKFNPVWLYLNYSCALISKLHSEILGRQENFRRHYLILYKFEYLWILFKNILFDTVYSKDTQMATLIT